MKNVLLIAILSGIVLSGCASVEEAVKTPARTNVSFTSGDGTEIDAFLAVPDGSGTFSAVLMIHEWWGLNQDVAIMAEALAAEGYVVLAPDAFRGELATSVPAAIAMNRSTPEEQIFADLDAALGFLMSHEAVDPDRVATMGFCFGGRQSMHLGIRSDGLAAVITLYGSGLVTEPENLGRLADNAPVLGIFGEDDNSIPLRNVRAFEAALDEVGASNTITVYPDVGHAFVKSSTFRESGPAGEAWEQVVEFLNAEVK